MRSRIFCYTAISSSSIIGILPGYLIRKFFSVVSARQISYRFDHPSYKFLRTCLEECHQWQR
jgi:hypothetical protein